MDNNEPDSYAYDAFASYATDPDRYVVRDVEAFLEGLHQNRLVAEKYRKRLEFCVDGSDFRLARRLRTPDVPAQTGLQDILKAYLAQCRHLVVFVGPQSAPHPWIQFELNWWIENRAADSILLAVTHGDDPKTHRQASFPGQILDLGIDQWPWFDLRGFRKSRASAIAVRPYEEERLRLASAILGPEVSAADLIQGWRQAVALQRRRQTILRFASAAVLLLGVASILWLAQLWRESSRQGRVSNWALASRQLGAGALNRKVDSVIYALAAMADEPTAEGYGSLISAIEPLPAFVRTIRQGGGHSTDTLRFLDRDRVLVSAGYEGLAEFYAPDTGQILGSVKLSSRAAELAECPAASLLAFATNRGVDIVRYSPDPSHPEPQLAQHLEFDGRVRAVAFHPDGKRLLVGAFDGTLARYGVSADGKTWRLEKSVKLTDDRGANIGINGLAPDWADQRLVVVDIEGVLYPLDSERWTPAGPPVRHSTEIFGVDVTQNGSLAAGSEAAGGIVIFDPKTARIVARLATQADVQTVAPDFQGRLRSSEPTGYPRTGIAISSQGGWIAAAGHDRTIRVYTASDRSLARIIVENDATRSVAFSSGGDLIATGADDGAVKIWNLSLNAERWRYAGIESVAIDAGGQNVATGGDDRTLRVLDAASGRVLASALAPDEYLPGKSGLDGLTFTPNGRHVASRTLGSTRMLDWTFANGPVATLAGPRLLQNPNEAGHVATVEVMKPGPGLAEILTGDGHQGHGVRVWNTDSGVARLAFELSDQVLQAASGKEFFLAADKRGELHVWSAKDGLPVAGLKLAGSPQALTATPSGRRFFVGVVRGRATIGKVCDLNATRDRPALECVDLSLAGLPIDARFSPDGKTLALSVGTDILTVGRLYLAQESSHWRLDELPSKAYVQSLAFDLTGSFLAAGQREGGIAVWKTAAGKLQVSIPLTNPVRAVIFAGKSASILVSLDGVAPAFVRAWDWNARSLVQEGCLRWPPDYRPNAVPGIAALPPREQICPP